MAEMTVEERARRLRAKLKDCTLSEDGCADDGVLIVHQCPSPTIAQSGFHFQRCGGGRRVIRKRIGRN